MKKEEKSKNIDDMTVNELKNYVKELEEYKNKDGMHVPLYTLMFIE